MGNSYEIEGKKIVERQIKSLGSGGAHVTAPKDWIGATVKLVRTDEPVPEDDE